MSDPMRPRLFAVLCAPLLCMVALSGCGKDRQPMPTSVARAAAAIPPTCEDARIGDAPADARLVALLTRTGDLEFGRQHFRMMRYEMDRALATFDAAAPVRFKAALDPLFSDDEVRRRLTCAFAHEGRKAATVDAWEAWIADPEMRLIHRRVLGPMRPEGPIEAQVDARRDALLGRVARATGFVETTAAAGSVSGAAMHRIEIALGKRDAAAPSQPSAATAPPKRAPIKRGADGKASPPPPDSPQLAAGRWLATQLDGIDNDTLQRFIAFAESDPGRAFYRALHATYAVGTRDWQARLTAAAQTQIAPNIGEFGADTLPAKLAEAERLLEAWAMPAQDYPEGLYKARTLVQNAERFDAKNTGMLILKARVEMALRPHLSMAAPMDRGQIRDRKPPGGPNAATGYEQIDRDLAKAIMLEPSNADAHLHLGRSKFLQLNDTVARHMLREARRLKAEPARLALYEGDLAYVGGDFASAERLYRESLAVAEAASSIRDLAARHLGNALRAQGRGAEYPAIAQQTLLQSPDLWLLRFDYADALLDGAGSAADAQAAIAAVPDTWRPDRRKLAATRVQVQTVIEAAPAARPAEAKRVHEIARDTTVIGQALCGARDVGIIDMVIRASPFPNSEAPIARVLLGCAVRERRADAVAVALPYLQNIDEPLNELWSDSALCGAAARNDSRTLTLLLQKKADTARRCGGSETPRERLAAQAAKGDAEARNALAAFDALVGGK
jgi:hypothetical protein